MFTASPIASVCKDTMIKQIKERGGRVEDTIQKRQVGFK